jgi:hypothetical protein
VPNGSLSIGGGASAVTVTGADVDLAAGAITIGSAGATAASRVSAIGVAPGSGTLVINTSGAGGLQILGGGAGAFAELVSTRGTSVTVNGGGSLVIRGGAGIGAYALIDPTLAGDLSVTLNGGGSLTLDGGGGAGASAMLRNLAGNVASNVVPVFVKNAGNDADATILVGAGRTVSFAGVTQTATAGNPVGNGLIDSGIFMLEPPVVVIPLLPPGTESAFQGSLSNLPQALPALPAPPAPKAKGDVVVESDDGC